MKIAPSRNYLKSLETVAITDIVLNMFIFFFISFSLLYTFNPTKTKQIKVNLPRARHVTGPQKNAKAATITLSSEGPVYLDGSVVTLKELESRLEEKVKDEPMFSVVIRIDRLVAFKNVVRVLDVLNGLGIERLRIAAEEEAP